MCDHRRPTGITAVAVKTTSNNYHLSTILTMSQVFKMFDGSPPGVDPTWPPRDDKTDVCLTSSDGVKFYVPMYNLMTWR
jgi:hypothetical protein